MSRRPGRCGRMQYSRHAVQSGDGRMRKGGDKAMKFKLTSLEKVVLAMWEIGVYNDGIDHILIYFNYLAETPYIGRRLSGVLGMQLLCARFL